MQILLDSHALWWFIEGSAKLPKETFNIIKAFKNNAYISIATLWEVAIKLSINKLTFDGGIEHFIEIVEDNGFSLLGISTDHIKKVTELPFIHRDPFDRIIIAQSMVENMTIITVDENIQKYDVNVAW